MLELIKTELKKLNIELVSCLGLDECQISRPYLLDKYGIKDGSVIVFAVPYLSKESMGNKNISSYAVPKDYHLFFNILLNDIIEKLKTKYPEYIFACFSDHSPINEIDACAKAGLGVIGTNHMLITQKYSSYVFLGEIITNASLPSFAGAISHCIDCKKCIEACPAQMQAEYCLSAITQKKNDLNEYEISAIRKHRCAWGCDICQEACPYTIAAIKNGTIYTNVDFFKKDLTPFLLSDKIEHLDNESFAQRAYSWRGKKVILRNLKILEGKEL